MHYLVSMKNCAQPTERINERPNEIKDMMEGKEYRMLQVGKHSEWRARKDVIMIGWDN